jgi:hypothetical protein
MKIRISGNSIRLRLTQSEVSLFVIQGSVSAACQIGNQTLTYEITQDEAANQVKASMAGQTITVHVPKEIAQFWDVDTRVGFDAKDENGLYVLVEKDFQCLKPRPHEDESDNFPNPQATIDTYD